MTKVKQRLLLWDIDGTLISTGAAGHRAIELATAQRFGGSGDLEGLNEVFKVGALAAHMEADALDDQTQFDSAGDYRGGSVKVAFWASRHARPILFLLAALIVGGAVAALRLPVALFPPAKKTFPAAEVARRTLRGCDSVAVDQMSVAVS